MHTRLHTALALAAGVAIGVSITVTEGVFATKDKPAAADPLPLKDLQTFVEILNRVKTDYVEPVDDKVLLDDHPDDNFATALGRSTAGAPRILERATFWAETILGGLAP